MNIFNAKRFSIKIITALTLLISFLSGCETNETCGYNQPAAINAVNGPLTGYVNQTVSFSLSFTGSNNCVQYGIVSEANEGFTRMIQLTANYEGCGCTAHTVERQATYNFSAPAAGTYYLNFLDSNNVFLIDTLTIKP